MVSRKAQSRAGVPEHRRGQEMGDARSRLDEFDEAEGTRDPALSGRRKRASTYVADRSAQEVGSGEGPRDNTPSVPGAIPSQEQLGETGGEKFFKKRQRIKGKRRK